MASDRIYRITSIGRPVDPAYATNRAVIGLAPLAGLFLGVVAFVRDAGIGGALVAVLTGMLVAFGGWAVARELAPDDQAGAFIAMVLAVLAAAWFGAGSLLVLFCALFLVRIVNRSVGLRARVSDALIVTGLVLWTSYSGASPALAAVAGLAFALDGLLAEPLRRQFAFAGVCLIGGAMILSARGQGGFPELGVAWTVALGAVSAGYLLVIASRTRSVDDVSGAPLDPTRARMGAVLGWLLAVLALTGSWGVVGAAPLWGTLAGAALGAAVMRARRGGLDVRH